MGVDLLGKQGTFSMNWTGWRTIYGIAIENGWNPAGTKPPNDEHIKLLSGDDNAPFFVADNWNGDYFSNDLQLVTKEDATSMADALTRSMEFQITDDDEWLSEFIKFARDGDFLIG
jgi:hypothetical protein|tara:strand:+ start:101 stop:448 length:348 start_codon:yes stop_codon:yes gene_type:complete